MLTFRSENLSKKVPAFSTQLAKTGNRNGIWWQWRFMTYYGYSLGCTPAQDASHHQHYYIFRCGDPELNLHLPLESWEGGQPKLYFFIYLWTSQKFWQSNTKKHPGFRVKDVSRFVFLSRYRSSCRPQVCAVGKRSGVTLAKCKVM